MGRGAPCRPIGGLGAGSLLNAIELGTGRVCGIGISGSLNFSGAGTLPALSSAGATGPPYFAPDFDVMGLRPADGLVKEIVVEETSGFDLPICRVRLANVDKKLSSTIRAKEQTSFRLRLGWTNPGLQDHGTFIVQRPQFRFDGSAEGQMEVNIVAYGEQVKLAVTERREVYRKMRDSDIVERIAARNGFEADVDRTDPVHDQVIQANESDQKFLSRRALLHGFLVMVEDSVLKFHAPRPCESGIRLTNQTLAAGINNFLSFTAQSRTFQRGLRLRITQVDPITKEEFEVVSSEDPTPVQRDTEHDNWADLVTIQSIGRPERFILNEGHEQRREQLGEQVSRMAEATRYVISGRGDAVGLETLHPQQIITLANVGRSSGRYIVTRVTHRISAEAGAGSFTTRFEVVRAGAGESEGVIPGVGVLPTPIESAGTVFASSAAASALAGFF